MEITIRTGLKGKKERVRRHTNNKGTRQIKRGKTRQQIKRIAKRLNIPYGKNTK